MLIRGLGQQKKNPSTATNKLSYQRMAPSPTSFVSQAIAITQNAVKFGETDSFGALYKLVCQKFISLSLFLDCNDSAKL